MPQVLESIDAISRREGRDVLMVSFNGRSRQGRGFPPMNEESQRLRLEIMSWLDAHQVRYEPCYGFWPDGMICAPYEGHLYLELPTDPAGGTYRELTKQLEQGTGSRPIAAAKLWTVPHDLAMTNEHHDSPEHEEW